MLNMWSNYEKQERLFNNVVEIMIFGIYNEPDNFIWFGLFPVKLFMVYNQFRIRNCVS